MRLEDYKNRNPFSTPEGYFEELNRNIIETTTKPQQGNVAKRNYDLSWWVKTLGYAAMLAIAVLFTDQILSDKNTEETVVTSAKEEQLYDNEFYEKLLENYTIDDYTFYCCLTEYE